MSPKVSVLLPVYNAAPYLREAVDSILNQTFTDFEFLIIDDGSTDASGEIIETYRDPRIVYVKNERNLGLVGTLNKGIDLAKGEYIARMDADDVSLPERFAKQVGFMDSHPEVGACGTAYTFFGDSNHTEVRPADYRRAFTLLASTPCLGHPTALIRKEVLTDYGIRYEGTFEYAADYALWIRLSRISCLCSLPEPLLLYRWHSSNMSKTDESRTLARAKARILWHELVFGKPLEVSQARYLKGESGEWETFEAGKRLIVSVLENESLRSPIDRSYYGQLTVTEWESKLIRRFGLRGLAACLMRPGFRKWSRATPIGLLAQYLLTLGIELKRENKNPVNLYA